MNISDALLESLKEWLGATNPGLVTRDDLIRLEARLDEVAELLSELEARISPGAAEHEDNATKT